MKKRFWLLGLTAIAFTLWITGCTSTIAAVKDIPADALCQLDLSTNYITVTSFDGESVYWKKGIGGFLTTKLVDLPAGTHTLTGDYDDGSIWVNGLSITFDFEANHVYMLGVKSEGALIGINRTMIFDITDLPGRQIKRK
jgi:hypothetical protein